MTDMVHKKVFMNPLSETIMTKIYLFDMQLAWWLHTRFLRVSEIGADCNTKKPTPWKVFAHTLIATQRVGRNIFRIWEQNENVPQVTWRQLQSESKEESSTPGMITFSPLVNRAAVLVYIRKWGGEVGGSQVIPVNQPKLEWLWPSVVVLPPDDQRVCHIYCTPAR